MTEARAAILLVCLGNICRSPLAEAALREAADRAAIEIIVDSAGTGGWHAGDPPDRRAQAMAREHGIDISGYRARQVTRDDFTRFTHIFALDSDNLADLDALTPPEATAELGLLLDLVPGREGESVADPYYGGPEGFAATWADVSAAAHALVVRLTA
ncbi:low molecular weight protein-tyrosine-phosphatase [Hephaestia mangrovi]|uniref:low molecular weight protein-tyrosine-phosphatase n=1 Tax=Hephaestia mangrovi TaxID=2873268 RepID=UPI001CA5FAB3|nr:low molecular weight protein-tyrosine-phosphatase [Hephaestia mangrovi]MBY8828091.1 low molecular weight phosphotyrosine protein phosphatase [Hephaestia mangrovi]